MFFLETWNPNWKSSEIFRNLNKVSHFVWIKTTWNNGWFWGWFSQVPSTFSTPHEEVLRIYPGDESMTLIFRYLNWSHCTIYRMYTCTNWSYWSGWLHKLVIPSWYKYDIVVLIPSGIPISGTSFTSGYCTISRYLNWSCCTLYDIYIYI